MYQDLIGVFVFIFSQGNILNLFFYVWNYFKKIVLSKFKNITNSLLFFFISKEIKVKRRHITVKLSPPHNELTTAQKLESSQPWKTTRLEGASLTPSMPKRSEKTTRHGQKYSFHSKKKNLTRHRNSNGEFLCINFSFSFFLNVDPIHQ